jgi:hypothetical protein
MDSAHRKAVPLNRLDARNMKPDSIRPGRRSRYPSRSRDGDSRLAIYHVRAGIGNQAGAPQRQPKTQHGASWSVSPEEKGNSKNVWPGIGATRLRGACGGLSSGRTCRQWLLVNTFAYRSVMPQAETSSVASDGYEQSIRAIEGLKNTLLGVNGKF